MRVLSTSAKGNPVTRRSYGGSTNGGSLLWPVLFLIALVGGAAWLIYWNTGPKQGLHTETITVCDMEDSKKSNDHEYRIYAANGTYKMDDSWIGIKRRNTADEYGRMKREIRSGAVTYDVTVKGERWNTPTNFPNIVKFTKSAAQTPKVCSES